MKISQKKYECIAIYSFYSNGILRASYYLPHHPAVPGACYKINALLRVYMTDVQTSLKEIKESFESHKFKGEVI